MSVQRPPSTGILVAFWDRHIASEANDAKVFDFGPYATLPKSCAVRGSALARLAPMLEQFLMVVPSCRACKKEMQSILLERINTSRRKLNTTSRLNEDVVRAIASAFSVVLSHARRLKNEKLFAQARASCKDGEDVAILDGLRESCKGTSSGSSSAHSAVSLETPKPKSRKLSHASSTSKAPALTDWPSPSSSTGSVRAISDGWPLSSSDEAPEMPVGRSILNASMLRKLDRSARTIADTPLPGSQKGLAAHTKDVIPKRKGTNENITTMPRLGKIKLEKYSKKSYITAFSEADRKWKCVVICDQKQCAQHHAVMGQLWQDCIFFGHDKEQMVRNKARIIGELVVEPPEEEDLLSDEWHESDE